MKSIGKFLFLVLACVALVYSVRATHARTEALSPGLQSYTPTRLEWLELELQASSREEDFTNPGYSYSVDYLAKPPDTIVVLAQYSKGTSAGLVDRAIEHCKRMVEKRASSHGWSEWVKVEVQRHLTENTKD